MGLAKSAGAQDLAICLISGGGSALLSLPAEGLSVDEKADLSIALMQKGADIHELNTVRRHLSRIKGGHLAQVLANSAHSHTLIISDVVGNQLQSIASGPTVADPTTFADAAKILKKYGIVSTKNVQQFDKSNENSNFLIKTKKLRRSQWITM